MTSSPRYPSTLWIALVGTLALVAATVLTSLPLRAGPHPIVGTGVAQTEGQRGPISSSRPAAAPRPASPLLPLGIDYSGCGGVTAPVVNAGYDQRIVELTNLQRFFFNNLPPYKRTTSLDDAARYHSADLGQDDYFDHDTYDRVGTNLVFVCLWSTRVQNYYGAFQALAENIAAGQTTPDDAILGWMNSPSHKPNIMSTAPYQIGAGYSCCTGTYTRYWTQDFGRQANVYPLVINREDGTTTSSNVNLYLYGSWTDMRLHNDNEPWGAWQPFTNNVSWVLSTTLGTRSVSAEMRTGITTVSATDTIDRVSGLPTNTPTDLATSAVSPTPTPTGTATPTRTSTPTATATKTATPTATPTSTNPPATSTATASPSATATATQTATGTATPTPSATASPMPTHTATSTATATASPLPSATSTPTSPSIARGDCNADGSVSAADLSAVVYEIFDGDGTAAVNAPAGSFVGHPVGCDANADSIIDAGDQSCTIRKLFYGGGASCP